MQQHYDDDFLSFPEYNDSNYQYLVEQTIAHTGNINGLLPRTIPHGSSQARQLGLFPLGDTCN